MKSCSIDCLNQSWLKSLKISYTVQHNFISNILLVSSLKPPTKIFFQINKWYLVFENLLLTQLSVCLTPLSCSCVQPIIHDFLYLLYGVVSDNPKSLDLSLPLFHSWWMSPVAHVIVRHCSAACSDFNFFLFNSILLHAFSKNTYWSYYFFSPNPPRNWNWNSEPWWRTFTAISVPLETLT